MKIYNSIGETVGRTPLLRLNNVEKNNRLDGILLAKLESFNPTGSVKDRAALEMINDAERSGRLSAGGGPVPSLCFGRCRRDPCLF